MALCLNAAATLPTCTSSGPNIIQTINIIMHTCASFTCRYLAKRVCERGWLEEEKENLREITDQNHLMSALCKSLHAIIKTNCSHTPVVSHPQMKPLRCVLALHLRIHWPIMAVCFQIQRQTRQNWLSLILLRCVKLLRWRLLTRLLDLGDMNDCTL